MVAATDQAQVGVEVLARDLMAVTSGIRRAVRRRVAGILPRPSLPVAQVDLLLVVEAEPGIGVAAAARSLHLAGNSVSALVNQLVLAGLLVRETNPSDRRAARLSLTPLAMKRIRRWRDVRTATVGGALARIGPVDRAAIERAMPALVRLLAQLRASELVA